MWAEPDEVASSRLRSRGSSPFPSLSLFLSGVCEARRRRETGEGPERLGPSWKGGIRGRAPRGCRGHCPDAWVPSMGGGGEGGGSPWGGARPPSSGCDNEPQDSWGLLGGKNPPGDSVNTARTPGSPLRGKEEFSPIGGRPSGASGFLGPLRGEKGESSPPPAQWTLPGRLSPLWGGRRIPPPHWGPTIRSLRTPGSSWEGWGEKGGKASYGGH